jgi:hypothetical protein
MVQFSVADPGSRIRCFFTPEFGMNFFGIADPATFLVKFSYIINQNPYVIFIKLGYYENLTPETESSKKMVGMFIFATPLLHRT